jgi:hypothetical protein
VFLYHRALSPSTHQPPAPIDDVGFAALTLAHRAMTGLWVRIMCAARVQLPPSCPHTVALRQEGSVDLLRTREAQQGAAHVDA